MNTDFVADAIDDSIILSEIKAYCTAVLSLSYSSEDCIDTVQDILDIINTGITCELE